MAIAFHLVKLILKHGYAYAAVRLATLPDDGSSGGFFDENGVVPW
ncbi:MAG: hypothetical protein RMY16_18725 [Nostoc sp. DedQUE12b]|nr:hypothetical protein [Nostoc sp. DedQUE12b]MDZ8087576.1 hypothetical protein [Nostoc sp. DedQUE12b]